MKNCAIGLIVLCVLGFASHVARAGSGDPQVKTNHTWYPGELAMSSFDRLAATQAAAYAHVAGQEPKSDQDRALAAWLWRNTHYWHGEEGAQDLWDAGFGQGGDTWTRDYWRGMFAHGFGLCGTTHAQWTAELNGLLGHNRARTVGVQGHNSCEVFLTGGPYGDGRWALLDHDLSTVIFDERGETLLSIHDVAADWRRLTDREKAREKQHGWLVSGLHPGDGASFGAYRVAEYLPGYAGLPPIVHLRRGESLRRYLRPGLADGKTFVFWGRNYMTNGIPGPERSLTWVNQPEAMHGSKDGPGYKPGQARFANAVYTYRPDFKNGDYREGVISETDDGITFEFYTPYIIAATPPNDEPWGIYQSGCRNGLVISGRFDCPVAISTDQGASWQEAGRLADGIDATDLVKGHSQYFVRFIASASELADANVEIVTVCQANSSTMPRLTDGESKVTFAASGRAVVSAGPNRDQARAHVVAGNFDTPRVTIEVKTPRGEPVVEVHAAAHVRSSSPPSPDVRYEIEYSIDEGRSWQPIVSDWRITRRGHEPKDFWSQSFCWGAVALPEPQASAVQVRFRNDGGKQYARAEVHVVYATEPNDPTRVTFGWTNESGPQAASHVLTPASEPQTWTLSTGKAVRTDWVEMQPKP